MQVRECDLYCVFSSPSNHLIISSRNLNEVGVKHARLRDIEHENSLLSLLL